jgi:hypothetical protein
MNKKNTGKVIYNHYARGNKKFQKPYTLQKEREKEEKEEMQVDNEEFLDSNFMDYDFNEQSNSQDNKKMYIERQKSLVKNWKDKQELLYRIILEEKSRYNSKCVKCKSLATVYCFDCGSKSFCDECNILLHESENLFHVLSYFNNAKPVERKLKSFCMTECNHNVVRILAIGLTSKLQF